MARPQLRPQEEQKPISERVSDVFTTYLFDISEMASAKRITAANRERYEKARRAYEEVRRSAGPDLDPESAAKLAQVEAALKNAEGSVSDDTKFAGDGAAAPKKAKPEKLTKKEQRQQRGARGAAREAALEPVAQETGLTGEGQDREVSLTEIANDWDRMLEPLERSEAYMRQYFHTFRSRGQALSIVGDFNTDLGPLASDVIDVLGQLGIPVNAPVEDMPDELRDVALRYSRLVASGAEMLSTAERYEDYLAERRADFETRGRDAEPIAREFITSCAAIESEITAVLALPRETPEERYIARARLEALVRGFKSYNDQWRERAEPNLPNGEQWLPAWTEAFAAHQIAHRAYTAIKQRREEFRGVAEQDWLVNSQHFSARLDVLRTRIIKAQTMHGREREDELAGLREYYISVQEDWDNLRSQVSRELQQEEGSPVKALGRVVRGIGADVQELLNEKDAKVLRAQEAYGELGRIVVRSFVCWNEGKTFAQRGAFLHRYLNNEVKDSDPEFGEFVRDRDVFITLVAPLAAAKHEIDVQASRRQAGSEARERNRLRRSLRHPWLFGLRADRADLMDRIIGGRFWKPETAVEERQRLIRLGNRLNDDDPGLVAAVQSVDRDIPTFRRAVADLEASKQAIIAFEDRLLNEQEEPAVAIDIDQLRNLGLAYSLAAKHEFDMLQVVIALDGWKIAEPEARRNAVGEFLRSPSRNTVEKFTDSPDAFREPLNDWRAAVEQKLDRRDAFRWALERNIGLIPSIGRLSSSAQRTVDMVLANAGANAPASEPSPVSAPEALDARGEAIRDRRKDIGNLLAHDMFWDPSVPRPARFSRINTMLRQRNADARLKSDDGLRNADVFYYAAAFTDFADLEGRMVVIRTHLLDPSGDVAVAAVAATASTPAATSEPVPPTVSSMPPAPVSAPAPAAALPSVASRPDVAAAPAAPSRPDSAVAPVAATVAAAGAASILSGIVDRSSARRAAEAAPAASAPVPPPLPPPVERAAVAIAGTLDSVRAAVPPVASVVRRVDTASVTGAPVRTAEAAAASRTEPVPARSEMPTPPELTNEVRVSSWAKSIRNTVGRWFGRDLGDYVASEITGEQMERERQARIMGKPEVVVRTVSGMMGIVGRVIGFQSLVDVPRYFTQSFIKENERALLRAEILEAMEHEAQGRAAVRDGDRQRASLEASTRLERAINTSAHLTSEQKAEMIARVNTMRTTYQERTFAVAEARSKELAELVEANVQAKVNGWRAAKETVNSALAVLSFGGAPLIAGVGYGAARGVSYLAMSFQEKYVAAAIQNPRASWTGKVHATFRDTWTSTWNRLTTPAGSIGQRLMNVVDAIAEISNAVGVPVGSAIRGLDRSLPALRSLEGSTDSGVAQIVAEAQQDVQNAADTLLPALERIAARQSNDSVPPST